MAMPPLPAARRRPTSSSQKAAIEDEVRRMVARELHDRVAQTLTGMLVEVENFKSQQVGWEDVLRQMDMVQSSTRQVLSSLRQLLHDLRGEEQVAGGLVDALRALVARFEARSGIAAELEVDQAWPAHLTSPAALNMFRIVEEALTNVRMHSGAKFVRIVLDRTDESLVLSITDDGKGVDLDPARPLGLGTVGMKERAMFLGGELSIESEPGAGATVRAVLPALPLIPSDVPRRLALTVEASL